MIVPRKTENHIVSSISALLFASRKLLLALFFISLSGFIQYLNPIVLQEFEQRAWDWRVALNANPQSADKQIKIITIDQSTLDFLNREYGLTWPIPREIYKHIIDFLSASGAKGVAFDLLFTESSKQDYNGDLIFAQATEGLLPVVSSLVLNIEGERVSQQEDDLFRSRLSKQSAQYDYQVLYGKFKYGKEYDSATLPYLELLAKSPGLGSVQGDPDSDGIFRHHTPFARFNGEIVPSLPFALHSMTSDKSEQFELAEFQDRLGRLTVNLHGGNQAYNTFRFSSILQSQAAILDGKTPEVPLGTFNNSFVLIGSTAPGLLDFRPTSLEERGYGVSYLASILDNIIHKNFIKKLSSTESFFLSSILVVFAISISSFILPLSKQLLVLGILFFSYLITSQIGAHYNFWIPLVLPILSLIGVIVAGLALEYQIEGRQHRFIRKAFQHYVSPTLVSQIVANPKMLSLGGEKKELSIFFSDIVGFTTASERTDPALLVSFLNEYLTLFTDIVQDLGGTVDKFVGDEVVAFWNAPLDLDIHADRALESAISCQRKLIELGDYYISRFGISPATRIGVHTAPVSVGNFGSLNRFNYTVIGDGVNLASRLEGANKYFGTSILFSEATRKVLRSEVPCREVGDIRVLGKNQSMKVFEPIYSQLQTVSSEIKAAVYMEGLNAFKDGQLVLAAKCFRELDHDPVSGAYLKRIAEAGEVKIGSWDSVWDLTQK